MTSKSRRAAIYARISRDRVGAGLGVDRQETDCRELADRLGWIVVNVLVDNDVSASSGRRRPGYDRLLAEITAGDVNAVIAWHSDRLHRRPVELEDFVTVCESHDVVVQTVKAGEIDLSTASGRMVARMLGAAARHEVEHAGERQRRSKAQAASEGRWRGGRRPYGWEADGVTVVPDEAEAVAAASRDVLAGASLRSISGAWNAAGRLTSTGKTWTPTEVRRVLKRPRNGGLVATYGEIVGEGAWDGIVPVEVWKAVTALLDDPGRRTSPGSARRWLLSGLAICGLCGGPMQGSSTGSKARKRLPSYRCKNYGHLTRDAHVLDDMVTDMVIRRLSRPDAIDLLAAPTVDVDALRQQALALRARLDEIAAAYGDGAIDARQLREGSARLRAQLEDVDRHLATAASGTALDGLIGTADVRLAWDRLDLSRRQAVVDTLLSVTIRPARKGRQPGGSYFDPGSVVIDWRSE